MREQRETVVRVEGSHAQKTKYIFWVGLFCVQISLLNFCVYSASVNQEHILDSPLIGLLKKYKRGTTLFQLGVLSPERIFSCAKNFPQTSWIVLEDACDGYGTHVDYLSARLKEQCPPHSLVLLSGSIKVPELEILKMCEHFDIVVITDLIERFQDDWHQALTYLLELGDNTFVVFSPKNEHKEAYKSLEAVLKESGGVSVNSSASEKVYLIQRSKAVLEIPCWRCWRNKDRFTDLFRVRSTFDRKELYKKQDNVWKRWVRGINAYTFVMLHGVYPTNEMIRNRIKGFMHIRHNDCKLWNMIIQGSNVRLIDFDDKRFSCSKKIHELRIKVALDIFNDDSLWLSDPCETEKRIADYYKEVSKLRNISKWFDF